MNTLTTFVTVFKIEKVGLVFQKHCPVITHKFLNLIKNKIIRTTFEIP